MLCRNIKGACTTQWLRLTSPASQHSIPMTRCMFHLHKKGPRSASWPWPATGAGLKPCVLPPGALTHRAPRATNLVSMQAMQRGRATALAGSAWRVSSRLPVPSSRPLRAQQRLPIIAAAAHATNISARDDGVEEPPQPQPSEEHPATSAAGAGRVSLIPTSTRPPQPAAPHRARWAAMGAAVLLLAIGFYAAMGLASASANLPPVAAVSSVSLSDWAGEQVLFWLDKASRLHVTTKVLLVLASTAPAILLFGAIHSALAALDLRSSCIKMYALLMRLPGAAVLNEATVPAALLVNTAYFIGLFTFAIILGVVTDEIKVTFKDARDGRFPVHESGHLVILGWNQLTIPLLRQVAAAKKAGKGGVFSRPVAVMADQRKTSMDATIWSRLQGSSLDVITRSGNPLVPSELAYVSAAKAGAIIVLNTPSPELPPELHPWTLGSGAAQTAVSLAAGCPPSTTRSVVFQAPERQAMDCQVSLLKKLSQHVGTDIQVMSYSETEVLKRLVAMCALEPGMHGVVTRVLGPANASLQAMPVPPALQGCTYQSVRRQFADGVVCGVLRGDDVNLLVPELQLLERGDQLIMLAADSHVPVNELAERVFVHAASNVEARMSSRHQPRATPRHIILISLDVAHAMSMADIFAELAPKGSQVSCVLPGPPPADAPSRKGNCNFKYITTCTNAGPRCTAGMLREAGIDAATSVVVSGWGPLGSVDADAFVTTTLLQVQEAIKSSGRTTAPHFVADIARNHTRATLATYLDLLAQEAKAAQQPVGAVIQRPDLVLGDDITASILAQAAARPAYTAIVSHLLRSMGAELYFRDPAVLNLRVGDLLTFADVAETARVFNETAVGVITLGGEVVLAPEPTYPINFQAGDRIIVLAAEYSTTKAKGA